MNKQNSTLKGESSCYHIVLGLGMDGTYLSILHSGGLFLDHYIASPFTYSFAFPFQPNDITKEGRRLIHFHTLKCILVKL